MPNYLKTIYSKCWAIMSVKSTHLIILVSLYFLFGLNFVLIKHLYSAISTDGFMFILGFSIAFVFAFILVLTPLVSKYIAKPILILIILTSAFANYAMTSFNIVIDENIIDTVFSTDSKEALSYLNIKLFIWIILSGIVPSIYIAMVKITYQSFLKELAYKLATIIISLLLIIVIGWTSSKHFASFLRDNPNIKREVIPTYYLGKLTQYLKAKYFSHPIKYKFIGKDAERINSNHRKTNLLVVVIGEASRAQNYQLDGYKRATNPLLSKVNHLVSFRHAHSCGTLTAVSVPCMFSFLGSSHYSSNLADNQDNVIDVIKYAGYQQIWLDNNSTCKGVCSNIEYHQAFHMKQLTCSGKEQCTDQILLEGFDQIIEKMAKQDSVVYLHLLGSHGPEYYKRYPDSFEFFKPVCQTSDLQKCTQQEIINAYDNSIRYTDYIISQLIIRLQKMNHHNTGLVYLADHGESLGEHGLYLHGIPYAFAPDVQKHIPFIFWFSKNMLDYKKISLSCLTKEAHTKEVSQDNLASTLLGLLDVKTSAYKKQQDIVAPCINK